MNLFIIGVQKTGTSAISHWFEGHPGVDHDISLKDVHFLSPEFVDRFNKKDDFLSIYEGSLLKNNTLFIGVNYWKEPQVLKKISADNFRLAIIIRNPIYRTISAYNYFCKKGELSESLADLCVKYMKNGHDPFQIFSGSFYSGVFDVYSQDILDNLIIIKYEKIISNTNVILKYLCDVLNVEFIDSGLKKVNVSGEVNKLMIFLFRNKLSKLINRQFLTKIIGFELKRKLYFRIRDLYVVDGVANKVDEITHKYLNEIFHDEIEWYEKSNDSFC